MSTGFRVYIFIISQNNRFLDHPLNFIRFMTNFAKTTHWKIIYFLHSSQRTNHFKSYYTKTKGPLISSFPPSSGVLLSCCLPHVSHINIISYQILCHLKKMKPPINVASSLNKIVHHLLSFLPSKITYQNQLQHHMKFAKQYPNKLLINTNTHISHLQFLSFTSLPFHPSF